MGNTRRIANRRAVDRLRREAAAWLEVGARDGYGEAGTGAAHRRVVEQLGRSQFARPVGRREECELQAVEGADQRIEAAAELRLPGPQGFGAAVVEGSEAGEALVLDREHAAVRTSGFIDGLEPRARVHSGKGVGDQERALDCGEPQWPGARHTGKESSEKLLVAGPRASQQYLTHIALDDGNAKHTFIERLRTRERAGKKKTGIAIARGNASQDALDIGKVDFACEELLIEGRKNRLDDRRSAVDL